MGQRGETMGQERKVREGWRGEMEGDIKRAGRGKTLGDGRSLVGHERRQMGQEKSWESDEETGQDLGDDAFIK